MATNTSSTIITTREQPIIGAIPGDAGITISQGPIITNTTTVTRSLGEVVTNVSYIPYMRGIDIDFVGYRLRPLRKIWYYFDDVLMNGYIQRPNIIETDSNNKILVDILHGARETIQIGSSSAKVLLIETNENDGNTRIYVSEVSNPSTLSVGSTITSANSSYTSKIKKYIHYSGVARSGSSVQNIKLSLDSDNSSNDCYVGNTITLLSGSSCGETREIIAYDSITRTATVSPNFSNYVSNSIYSIGESKSSWSSDNDPGFYVSARGYVAGVLHIPDPSQHRLKFKTGDRIFTILDNNINNKSSYTTRADYRFVSNGLNLSKAQLIQESTDIDINSLINITIDPSPTPTPTPTVTPTRSVTPTPTITPTVTPSITPSSTVTPSVTGTPAASVTPTPSVTPSISGTPSIIPVTPSVTPSVTRTPVITVIPPITPAVTRTPTPTPSSFGGDPCFPSLGSTTTGNSFKMYHQEIPAGLSTGGVFSTQGIGSSYGKYSLIYASGSTPIAGSPNFLSYGYGGRASDAVGGASWRMRYIGTFDLDAGLESPPAPNTINPPVPSTGTGGLAARPVIQQPSTISVLFKTITTDIRFPTGSMIFVRTTLSRQREYTGPYRFGGVFAARFFTEYERYRSCFGIPHDPIAQTFYVDTSDHPDGVFVTSVDLFFKNKGTFPVDVHLRPVVNGYPSSDTIIPDAVANLDAEDVNISDLPNVSNSMTSTRFTFPAPIYLNSGYEYAIVAMSDDYGYDYYSAELGKQVIGSDKIASKQPMMGSLFKSQNSRTWNAIQSEDLMFVLNKAAFDTTGGTVYLKESKKELNKDLVEEEIASLDNEGTQHFLHSNTYIDAFEIQSDAIELNRTAMAYYYKSRSNATGQMDSTYTNIMPEEVIKPSERKVIGPQSTNYYSFDMRVDMTSTSPHVSPILYYNRQNLIGIENFINNTGLVNDYFKIVNPGSGFTGNANLSITSNSVGYGAEAYAVANTTTGTLSRVIVTNAGTGYVGDVSVSVLDGGGSGANIAVITETQPAGGTAFARYISKTITLLDGFDAGDLRVWCTAVKPPGANVEIYYKVRNNLDNDPIENRNWVRMVQKTSQFTYSLNGEQIEYEYRPSLTSNNITYTTDTTTYKTFNQFAIKVVLTSDSTVASKVPYVYDLRATALPEDVY